MYKPITRAVAKNDDKSKSNFPTPKMERKSDHVSSLLREFPLWLSGLRTQLVSMRMRVPSLALLGGLRIWRGCVCSVGRQVQLQFDPLPGNLHMAYMRP